MVAAAGLPGAAEWSRAGAAGWLTGAAEVSSREGVAAAAVVPVAVTVRETGMRKVCDPLGPLSLI